MNEILAFGNVILKESCFLSDRFFPLVVTNTACITKVRNRIKFVVMKNPNEEVIIRIADSVDKKKSSRGRLARGD